MEHADPTRSGRFEYDPAAIRYGTGCIDDLADELARHGCERALVVCGRTVGSTPEAIDPVREGLGDRLGDVFAGTTPEKRLETALEAVEAMADVGADCLVGFGGGSSLDVATVASALAGADGGPEAGSGGAVDGEDGAAGGRDRDALARELAETGTLPIPEGDLPPVVAVPTTLAGADLSQVAGVTAVHGGVAVSGGVSDPRLMPAAAVYDPALFATTPRAVLAGSAMNGFDKGLEAIYAGTATPITDATAARGLALLREGLPALGPGSDGEAGGRVDAAALEPVVEGLILVQYGISRPGESALSIVHAFGHGLRDHGDLQQGVAHAVVVPHVLRYLFERVDARRDLLADALAVPREGRSDAEVAAGVVDAVAAVRDALGLPSRLRNLEGIERSDLGAVAEATREDSLLETAPDGLEPTVDDLRTVLEAAW